MADQDTEANWHALTEEVMIGLAEWRLQHPRATLAEIEREVDARLAGVRVRMVQDMALRSQQQDISVLPAAERPVCGQCGTALEARGKGSRRLRTSHNREVQLTRSYAVCPTCGSGLFPPG